MIIHKSIKFRLYPNTEQRQALERQFGCACFVFNTFLRERMEYYAAHKGEGKQGLNYPDTARLEMGKRINETLKENVMVGLAASGEKTIFKGTGRHTGLKVFKPEHLLKMVKVYDLV